MRPTLQSLSRRPTTAFSSHTHTHTQPQQPPHPPLRPREKSCTLGAGRGGQAGQSWAQRPARSSKRPVINSKSRTAWTYVGGHLLEEKMFINGTQHYGGKSPFARPPLKLEPLVGGMLLHQLLPPYSAFRFRASRRFQKSVPYFAIMLWHTSFPVLAWQWARPPTSPKRMEASQASRTRSTSPLAQSNALSTTEAR